MPEDGAVRDYRPGREVPRQIESLSGGSEADRTYRRPPTYLTEKIILGDKGFET